MWSSWRLFSVHLSSLVQLKPSASVYFAVFRLQTALQLHLNKAKTPVSIFNNWLMRLQDCVWWKTENTKCSSLSINVVLYKWAKDSVRSQPTPSKQSYMPPKAQQRANTLLLTLLTFGILDGAHFLCDRFTCIFIPTYGPPEWSRPTWGSLLPSTLSWVRSNSEDLPVSCVLVG